MKSTPDGGSMLDLFSWRCLGRSADKEGPAPCCSWTMRHERPSALECRQESRPPPPTLSPPVALSAYRAACCCSCCWRTWATLEVKMLVTEKCCVCQVGSVEQVWSGVVACGRNTVYTPAPSSAGPIYSRTDAAHLLHVRCEHHVNDVLPHNFSQLGGRHTMA